MSEPAETPASTGTVPTGGSPRRLYRPANHRLVGGVAQGLSEHLGIPAVWIRLAFVVATAFNLAGVIAYAAFWVFVPIRGGEDSTPGLESAERRGLRTSAVKDRITSREVAQTVAMLALGVGIVTLLSVTGWGLGGPLFIPIVLGVAGVALIWRQADERRWSRWVAETSGWHAATRLALGAILVALAFGFFVVGNGGVAVATDVLSALVVALIGAALILGPWIYKLTSDLGEERRERIRSQERADVAAHLHDSVLQTLALLQRNASDPATVATLARRQERELRDWLYGGQPQADQSLRVTLSAAAAEIESMHHVPIEVVGVGDTPVDPDIEAMARAAREAMTNASKHSGAERVDVYVEVSGGRAEVFVRDRGVGFDPDSIPPDRMGVRGSIMARVERHGGTATIRSAPGDGTEVRVSMPVGDSVGAGLADPGADGAGMQDDHEEATKGSTS